MAEFDPYWSFECPECKTVLRGEEADERSWIATKCECGEGDDCANCGYDVCFKCEEKEAALAAKAWAHEDEGEEEEEDEEDEEDKEDEEDEDAAAVAKGTL